MTYNVFVGTLDLTQLLLLKAGCLVLGAPLASPTLV